MTFYADDKNIPKKKPLTTSQSIRAVLIGFAIGGFYTIILMFVFGEEGWYEFDANRIPTSILDQVTLESHDRELIISDECKSLIQEYLVYKNYVDSGNAIRDKPELRYEQQLKEELYGENCW